MKLSKMNLLIVKVLVYKKTVSLVDQKHTK